jgi:hypothetical protein
LTKLAKIVDLKVISRTSRKLPATVPPPRKVGDEKDAVFGPIPIEILARVAAQMGEPDRAIAALQKLLSIPYVGAFPPGPLTPALLQLDPRFQKLVASLAPKANS